MARDSLDMSGSDSDSSLLESIPDGSVRIASSFLNTPMVHLLCVPNSLTFDDRIIPLNEPVKVGRCAAKFKATPNNAIFDCRVLSRNHALITFEDGKFFVQDTQSSNGTFVNNNRLSKGADDSVRREIFSGDIVQFGVNVIENSKTITHGCIIAYVKLFRADGSEHTSSRLQSGKQLFESMSCSESYDLMQSVYDAAHRENALREKINLLQTVVEQLSAAAENSWQTIIGEERLLSEIEMLEGKLSVLGHVEHATEITNLISEKKVYETNAKESISKILQEKLTAIRKCDELDFLHKTATTQLRSCEAENTFLKQQLAEFTSSADAAAKKNEELFAKMEERNAPLEKRLLETIEVKTRFFERICELQVELDNAKAEARRKVDSPQSEKSLTIEEVASESEDKISLDSSQGESKSSKDEIENLKATIKKLTDEMNGMRNENISMLGEITLQKDSFNHESEVYLAERMDWDVQLTMFKREAERVPELEERCRELLARNKLLEENQSEGRVSCKRDELSVPNSSLDSAQLKSLQETIEKLQIELLTVKQSFAKCQEEKVEMRKEVIETQKNFGGMAKQVDSLCRSSVVPLMFVCIALFLASQSFYTIFGSKS